MQNKVFFGQSDVECVKSILHYMWDSECDDYFSFHPLDRKGHVFESMLQLRNLLGLHEELPVDNRRYGL